MTNTEAEQEKKIAAPASSWSYNHYGDMHVHASRMDTDHGSRREDYELVTGFYEGQAPYDESELEALGLNENVNHLTGHTALSDVSEQIQALYYSPTITFQVDCKKAPDHLRQRISNIVSEIFNDVIKDSQRLDPWIDHISGECTYWGITPVVWADSSDWVPSMVEVDNFLIPSGTNSDPLKVPYWVIRDTLSLKEIMNKLDKARGKWKREALLALIGGKIRNDDDMLKTLGWDKNYDFGWGDWESIRDHHADDIAKIEEEKVKIYRFFQSDLKKKNGRVRQTVLLAEHGDERSFSNGQPSSTDRYSDICLYDNENFGKKTSQVLNALSLPANVNGGATDWHKTIGLGVLNYELDRAVEQLINRMREAYYDNNTNLFQATDGADIDDIEQTVLRNRSIIPPTVNLVSTKVQNDIRQAFPLIQMFSQTASSNAAGASKGGGGDMLEAELIVQQQATNQRRNFKLSKFRRRLEKVGQEMYRRLSTTTEPGCEEAGLFWAAIKEKVGNEEAMELVKAENVKIRINRLPGDGNPAAQQLLYQHFQQNMGLYDPGVRAQILHMMTYMASGDYGTADTLSPIDAPEDTSQIRVAMMENAITAFHMKAPQKQITDVDEHHFLGHFEGLKAVLIRMEADPSPMLIQTFQALATHTMEHVQAFFSEKERKNATRQVQLLAGTMDKMSREVPEAGGDEISNEDRELALKEREQGRKEAKDQTDLQRWTVSQQHRQQQATIQNQLQSFHAELSKINTELKAVKLAAETQTANRQV